jgi:glycosyltransferase involved in cell wall biosynthesis
MKNQLISIVMPAYNTSKFIVKAIESVINQTYQNWELIIVNDGSTDNTLKKVEKIKITDNRISVYSISNSGVSFARNFGFFQSNNTSTHLYFMDSDDIIGNNFLEIMIKSMKDFKARICFCDYNYIDKQGIKINNRYKFNNYEFGFFGIRKITSPVKFVGFETIYTECVISESNVIWEKKLFFEFCGWNKHLKFAEGRELYYKVAMKYNFLFLNQPLFNYRIHNNQTTNILSDETIDNNVSIVEKCFNNIANENNSNKLKFLLAKKLKFATQYYYEFQYLYFNYRSLSFTKKLQSICKLLVLYALAKPTFWFLFSKLYKNIFFREC